MAKNKEEGSKSAFEREVVVVDRRKVVKPPVQDSPKTTLAMILDSGFGPGGRAQVQLQIEEDRKRKRLQILAEQARSGNDAWGDMDT